MFEQPLKPDTPVPQDQAPQAGQAGDDVSEPAWEREPEDDPEIHPAPPPTDPESR